MFLRIFEEILRMKKLLLLFTFVFVQVALAQVTIKGNVTSKNTPLEGAAVYINNSSIGTTTDSNGDFELRIRSGKYDIVVSFLGFKTITYTLNTENYTGRLVFKMQEEANLLDEIVIRNTVYDDAWRHNLEQFKISFIGTSSMAKNVEIINPKDLHFDFDPTTSQLEAHAKAPLKIKNKSLGYLITYDLVSFTQDREKVTYVGYTRYENLRGRKGQMRRWKKNRMRAYLGSRTHFFQSLLANTLKEDGFRVNQFRRVPNPSRPTKEAIIKARKFLIASKTPINYRRNVSAPKNAIDSALLVLRKARLPKFRDYLYKKDVPYNEIITKKENRTYLTFENYLSVIYSKEKEDLQYLSYQGLRTKRAPGPQTSALVVINKAPYVLPTGQVINPLDVFHEGYWGFEKMAETLPLDYELPSD